MRWICDPFFETLVRPLFKDGEVLVGRVHADLTMEREGLESVYDVDFGLLGACALEGVDGELEGAGVVSRVVVAGPGEDGGEEGWESWGGGPVCVDSLGEEGTADESPGGVLAGQSHDAKGGLDHVSWW